MVEGKVLLEEEKNNLVEGDLQCKEREIPTQVNRNH